MLDAKSGSNLIAYVTVADEVEKISFYFLFVDVPTHFQPVLSHTTDRAACTVLKNQTRNYAAAVNDGFDIIDVGNVMPVHFEYV